MNTPDNLVPALAATKDGQVDTLAQGRGDEQRTGANRAGSRRLPDATSPRWLTENLSALRSSNSFVERYELPLKQYRNF